MMAMTRKYWTKNAVRFLGYARLSEANDRHLVALLWRKKAALYLRTAACWAGVKSPVLDRRADRLASLAEKRAATAKGASHAAQT
jgi:hypothetical protein